MDTDSDLAVIIAIIMLSVYLNHIIFTIIIEIHLSSQVTFNTDYY